jgi:type I restriction enzyme S subunit
MSEWKTYKLGDLVEINKNSINKNFAFSEIEYIDTSSVTENRFSVFQILNLEDAPSRAKRIVKENDIIYSTVRPILRHYGIMKNAKPNTIASTGFAVLTSKNIDPNFLYYFLTTDEIVYYLNSVAEANTTTYPAFNASLFENIEVTIPSSIEEQTQIAQILNSLDDKIELNLQMNKTLEAMAQAIFKEWFVDFKFPLSEPLIIDDLLDEPDFKKGRNQENHNNQKNHSSDNLPKGWRKFSLSDLVDTVSKTFKFPDGKAIFLNTSDILEGKFLHTNYTKYEDLPGQAKKSIQKGDILFSEIRPANKRYAFVDFDAKDYVVSTKLMVLRSKGIVENLLVYFFMKSDEVLNQLQTLAETRSGTFPQITYFELSKILINVPTQDILERFTAVLQSSFEKIRANQSEIQTLTATRDTLLPKLMSGKISLNL